MNYSVNLLRRFSIHALDGDLGRVSDIFFDDETWTVRYLVVDTGAWLPGRKVLISAAMLGHWDETRRVIQVDLTQEQVRNSPDVDTAMPVSRRHEVELHRHYGWPFYWTGMNGLGSDFDFWAPAEPVPFENLPEGDPHLRSAEEIEGYHVHARDGSIGHIDDVIIEDNTWHVMYLVAKTRNWFPGKLVLLEPEWISRISWEESEVLVSHTREEVRNRPALVA